MAIVGNAGSEHRHSSRQGLAATGRTAVLGLAALLCLGPVVYVFVASFQDAAGGWSLQSWQDVFSGSSGRSTSADTKRRSTRPRPSPPRLRRPRRLSRCLGHFSRRPSEERWNRGKLRDLELGLENCPPRLKRF